MSTFEHRDLVIGSGPNGLAAALTLARAGRDVTLLERADSIGGGCRTDERTLPGFRHDTCSAAHPLAMVSQFVRNLPSGTHPVDWVQPPIAVAHPFDDGTAAFAAVDLDATVDSLRSDKAAYRQWMEPLLRSGLPAIDDLLAPPHLPRQPLASARFARYALRSAERLARSLFEEDRTRALFAGMAAHSMLDLRRPASAAAGVMLSMLAHLVGWPFARGGSGAIVDHWADLFTAAGGEISLGNEVHDITAPRRGHLILADVAPRHLAGMAGPSLPEGYARALRRFRHGPGSFKIDYALSGPVPWTAEPCQSAGTVHLGGSFAEIVDAEAEVAAGRSADRPFVLVCQPSLFDPMRAPAGRHTLWTYCHVPNGSNLNMLQAIERQIERFAPGFSELVLARATMTATQFEDYNPNYVGGDIGGGVSDLRQLLTRPVVRWNPYRTPVRGLFICSASTPPGGGVHGLGGYFAARSALSSA